MRRTAALYRLDPDFSLTEVFGGMTISNGLAWSPDGRTMYHADTPTQTIHAYDYDARPARPPNPRVFARFDGDGRSARRRRRRQRRLLLDRALPRRQASCGSSPDGRRARGVSAPRDVPDDVRVRRPRPHDALRDERAPAARRRRARAAAAVGRHLRDARRRARAARTGVRRLTRERSCRFDPTAFLRLDAPQSLGASASGASFATSTGDILEVSCYGPGVFRLRVGPNTKPDYGLVLGRTQGVHRRARAGRTLHVHGGRRRCSRSPDAPLRFRLLHRGAAGARLDHRRAFPRLDAAADVRPRAPGRPVDRLVRARVGRTRVRPRREIRPARQARAAHPFARRRRAWRQHRRVRTRTRRSRGARAPATAHGASSSTRRGW